MNLLSRITIHGLHHHHTLPSLSPPHSLSFPQRPNLSLSKPKFKPNNFRVSSLGEASSHYTNNLKKIYSDNEVKVDGETYDKTLRLVECSMFAALGGLAYVLSSSLAIENYFGCFFALPIVFSSMRWGLAAGRKTMVATAILLLVLAGPIKALTYLLMYGLLGLTMGSLWRSKASWGLSVGLSAMARALGSSAYVVMLSFLIRENLFDHDQSSCYSLIHPHVIWYFYNSIDDHHIHHLRNSGFYQL
ncbi:uncharacterized protein LOC108197759 isoform X2 [Daucus carota subsp. sativus]|uniref:uncharacterized protein LOC108197759 isoform X2 n=1 Tax=Daucus carota subsp. sativus TaxID=79200 RepID=UPI003083238F